MSGCFSSSLVCESHTDGRCSVIIPSLANEYSVAAEGEFGGRRWMVEVWISASCSFSASPPGWFDNPINARRRLADGRARRNVICTKAVRRAEEEMVSLPGNISRTSWLEWSATGCQPSRLAFLQPFPHLQRVGDDAWCRTCESWTLRRREGRQDHAAMCACTPS